MARKKKPENKFNVVLALVIALFVAFSSVVVWSNRYELFPALIKDGVSVCFLTANGEDKIVKYVYAYEFFNSLSPIICSCIL